jgi:hypothetical protein
MSSASATSGTGRTNGVRSSLRDSGDSVQAICLARNDSAPSGIYVRWLDTVRQKPAFRSLILTSMRMATCAMPARSGPIIPITRSLADGDHGAARAGCCYGESAARRGARRGSARTPVAEIAYTEMTDAGTLRHPSYLGRREDKKPEAVVLDTGAGRRDRGAEQGACQQPRACDRSGHQHHLALRSEGGR